MNPNPYSTQSAPGTFSVQSDGFIQGMAQDDPATRFALAQGVLSAGEILPMWGGVGIAENIPLASANDSLGGSIARALTDTAITGFSVFDQNFAAVNNPASPVPTVNTGGGVMFYRLGSGARFAVAIDSAFAAALQGGPINAQATWDVNNQRLEAYNATPATVAITSITPTFVPAAAGQPAYENMVVVAAASNNVVTGVGDIFSISGATNTGTGGAAAVNGSFMVTAFTDSQHFAFRILTPVSTYIGAVEGTILMANPGGLFPGKILKVNIGNSKVVSYNNANGNAVWVPNQSCALVQI